MISRGDPEGSPRFQHQFIAAFWNSISFSLNHEKGPCPPAPAQFSFLPSSLLSSYIMWPSGLGMQPLAAGRFLFHVHSVRVPFLPVPLRWSCVESDLLNWSSAPATSPISVHRVLATPLKLTACELLGDSAPSICTDRASSWGPASAELQA